jgi:glycosyltransferase involved in cell wall biosynthesis
MVMVEAMACGTPVIAYSKGSVDEVVTENITGFKVNSFDVMLEVVDRLGTIDRTNCRNYARDRFDVPVIAEKYLSLCK